jgi:hypothetical protein
MTFLNVLHMEQLVANLAEYLIGPGGKRDLYKHQETLPQRLWRDSRLVVKDHAFSFRPLHALGTRRA